MAARSASRRHSELTSSPVQFLLVLRHLLIYSHTPSTTLLTVWSQDGIFATSRPNHEHCPNCARQADRGLIDSDVISLTSNLIAYWRDEEEHCGLKLQSLSVNEVLPFLRVNLHVRILDVSLSLVDRDNTFRCFNANDVLSTCTGERQTTRPTDDPKLEDRGRIPEC